MQTLHMPEGIVTRVALVTGIPEDQLTPASCGGEPTVGWYDPKQGFVTADEVMMEEDTAEVIARLVH